jgi:hypothetical protein
MSQNQLNREIANATGESVGLIRSLGFNVVIVPQRSHRPRRDGSAQSSAKQTNRVISTTQQPKAA